MARKTKVLNTHVYFLLDRSGSMTKIRGDVIGGFNQFVDEQRGGPNRCRLTLVQFDSQEPEEVIHNAVDIDKATIALTPETFSPRGMTPLNDATDLLLTRAELREKARDQAGKAPEAIMVVTFTDGLENASTRVTAAELKTRIDRLSERGWTFAYLGANQDSYAEASKIGYVEGATHDFLSTSAGTYSAYGASGQAVTNVRMANAKGMTVNTARLFEKIDVDVDDDVDDDEPTAS